MSEPIQREIDVSAKIVLESIGFIDCNNPEHKPTNTIIRVGWWLIYHTDQGLLAYNPLARSWMICDCDRDDDIDPFIEYILDEWDNYCYNYTIKKSLGL